MRERSPSCILFSQSERCIWTNIYMLWTLFCFFFFFLNSHFRYHPHSLTFENSSHNQSVTLILDLFSCLESALPIIQINLKVTITFLLMAPALNDTYTVSACQMTEHKCTVSAWTMRQSQERKPSRKLQYFSIVQY